MQLSFSYYCFSVRRVQESMYVLLVCVNQTSLSKIDQSKTDALFNKKKFLWYSLYACKINDV